MESLRSATIPGHSGEDSVPAAEAGDAGKDEPQTHKDPQPNSQQSGRFEGSQHTAEDHQQTVADAGLSFKGNGQTRLPAF